VAHEAFPGCDRCGMAATMRSRVASVCGKAAGGDPKSSSRWPRNIGIATATVVLVQLGVAGAGACSSSTAASLCASATGACVDGSTSVGLAKGYMVPSQYGATCTSGTYFIGPPSAWNGTCGATIYVLCLGGTWSGAYCGSTLGDGGWQPLAPDGAWLVAADAGEDVVVRSITDATRDGRDDATLDAAMGMHSDASSEGGHARDGGDAGRVADAATDARAD